MRICVAYRPSIGEERFDQFMINECPSAHLVWLGPNADSYDSESDVLVIMTQTVGSKAPRNLLPEGVDLKKVRNLKLIATGSTGYSHIDLDYCREHGVAIYATPDYATASVAELAVASALSLLRKLPEADASVRRGDWDFGGTTPGSELAGKTVGILGTGIIGLAASRLFAAFGCRLLGWSRSQKQEFIQLGGEYKSDLLVVARESDIVSIHLPLNLETSHIVGPDFLAQMGRSSILINLSRGGLVECLALEQALREGRIAGAALDVFDTEPLDGNAPICRLQNILLTPHLGFKTREALERLDREVIRNVGRFMRGDSTNRVV
jgi:D-3-phosphoglycerate dehydrogenase